MGLGIDLHAHEQLLGRRGIIEGVCLRRELNAVDAGLLGLQRPGKITNILVR
jgi:hypothetical protein